ncbi:MAG TPA: protein phosphatase 2C domain-containing protein [Candidatus Didemnitutus sp.]|nr:protein phosphatase 2C domain-containing protein [Candidatus Didemnitutus sp.]
MGTTETRGSADATPKAPVVPGILEWAAASDVGKHRDCNEDAWVACRLETGTPVLSPRETWPATGALFALSDGMGGARAGEVASRSCVDNLARRLAPPASSDDLSAAFLAVHAELVEAGRGNRQWTGMGATLSACVVGADHSVRFAHVGDSRIYHRSAGTWRQITEDHNLGEGLVRRGQMTAAAASRFRYRSLLEQVMGGDGRPIEPQVGSFAFAEGDAIALCCDGLYRPLEADLEARLDRAVFSADLAAGAQGLVDAANAAGGPDNITVILVRRTT